MKQPGYHSCASVFVSADVRALANYYHDRLGFDLVAHFDHAEPFAALYRGGVEILLVQAKHGTPVPNHRAYGAGYDVYLVVEDVHKDVDAIYTEYAQQGVVIIAPPSLTPYGNYEFVFEDPEGRRIGVGCVLNQPTFFRPEHSTPA